MEEVTLTAVSEEGAAALRALKAKVDVPLRDRFIYRRMYAERVSSEEPFTIVIKPKGAIRGVAGHVRVADFINELEIGLEQRGVERGLDYTIEGK